MRALRENDEFYSQSTASCVWFALHEENDVGVDVDVDLRKCFVVASGVTRLASLIVLRYAIYKTFSFIR